MGSEKEFENESIAKEIGAKRPAIAEDTNGQTPHFWWGDKHNTV